MTAPHGAEAPAPPLVIAASRSRTQAHVLAGLLHDLNGTLNNLGLTFGLLERALAPNLAPPMSETGTRLRRYLDSLAQESARMSAWSRGAAQLVHLPQDSAVPGAMSGLVDDARRLLRHHATLADVRLEVASPPAGADPSVADAEATRAALLTYLCAAIELAQAGGRVAVESGPRGESAFVRLAIASAVPATPGSEWSAPHSSLATDLLAGRLQVEAMSGSSRFAIDAGQRIIEVTLPAL